MQKRNIKMEHYEALSITAIALLLVASQTKTILAFETDICTCYSFHNITNTWGESNHYCQQHGGNLTSMETEEEYQFINKTIQSLDVGDNEWYIGLTGINYPQAGRWKWNSGHSMTIQKWSKGEPSGIGRHGPWYTNVCVKMLKYHENNKGLGVFDDVSCREHYMFMCESKTGQKCPSVAAQTTKHFERCTSQKKIATTTKSRTTTTTFLPFPRENATTPRYASITAIHKNHSYSSPPTDQISTVIISSSTENGQQTRPSIQTTIQEVFVSENGTKRPTKIAGDANEPPQSKSSNSESFHLVIVTVALGAVLAVSVCLLLFVCYWKRRNKRDKNENPRLETASLPPDATGHSSNNNQLGPEDGGFPEGVQLFTQNGGEPYVAYAVIHNNLAQQNKGPNASNEPAYASIQDENIKNWPSQKNDSNAATLAATMNADNSGNSVGDGKSNAEVVYASVDKSKKNNIKNESQNGNQWPSGQQVLYASVDNSKKSKYQAEDAVYAEVGSKDNMEKQQPDQITYAELADFNQNRSPEEAVKPAPYQPAEYAVIIGQKQKS